MKAASKYGMPTPKSREEFEHNLYNVIDEMINPTGKAFVTQSSLGGAKNPLSKLKQLPNGRLDLTTVDERLRLLSNMKNWVKLIHSHQIPSDEI